MVLFITPAKVLPRVSDISHPLHQLTVKNAWWKCMSEKAWNDIITAITQVVAVFHYYRVNNEVQQVWEPLCLSYSSS